MFLAQQPISPGIVLRTVERRHHVSAAQYAFWFPRFSALPFPDSQAHCRQLVGLDYADRILTRQRPSLSQCGPFQLAGMLFGIGVGALAEAPK
jgi:hypothetical protein